MISLSSKEIIMDFWKNYPSSLPSSVLTIVLNIYRTYVLFKIWSKTNQYNKPEIKRLIRMEETD